LASNDSTAEEKYQTRHFGADRCNVDAFRPEIAIRVVVHPARRMTFIELRVCKLMVKELIWNWLDCPCTGAME